MAESSERFLIVLSTAGSLAQALEIVWGLVERRLAACVNVAGGGCSIYHWQGKIVEEDEHLLVVKTAERLFPQVRAAIRELHSYEVPEVVAFPISDGDPDYLRWLGESVADR